MDGDPPDSYVKPILWGLHSGLERSAGAAQVAAIVEERGESRLWIYDPQQLLAPWKRTLSANRKSSAYTLPDDARKLRFGHQLYVRPPGFLTSTESEGQDQSGYPPRPASSSLQGREIRIAQVFAHVVRGRLFHTAGLDSFLNTAARILIAGLEARDKEVVRYGKFELEEHSKFATRRQIKELLKSEPEFSISQALSAVARISRAKEEGASPRGVLILTDLPALDRRCLKVEIKANRPLLSNPKHVCKLLLGTRGADQELTPGSLTPVQGLVSDGEHIAGLLDGFPPDRSVIVRFSGETGSIFCCADQTIIQAARFSGPQFLLTEEIPPSVLLERVLNESPRVNRFDRPTELVEHVMHLAAAAQRAHHGCTIVLGDPERRWRSGQRLGNGLSLGDNRQVAANLSSIDGAIQIDRSNRLIAFGGLLDGDEFPAGEDLARGGRYNSAIRFTRARTDVVVVVVSADGPVAVFADGEARDPGEDPAHEPLDPAELRGDLMDTWLGL